uniref:Uncharacterized protein n=1 Tax=Setaria italica TaxID=4555 RepID=K3ZDI0_SETIT
MNKEEAYMKSRIGYMNTNKVAVQAEPGYIRKTLSRYTAEAPTSHASCVGWFFESVIGRILDSGCRIETVLVILFKILRREDQDNIRITG